MFLYFIINLTSCCCMHFNVKHTEFNFNEMCSRSQIAAPDLIWPWKVHFLRWMWLQFTCFAAVKKSQVSVKSFTHFESDSFIDLLFSSILHICTNTFTWIAVHSKSFVFLFQLQKATSKQETKVVCQRFKKNLFRCRTQAKTKVIPHVVRTCSAVAAPLLCYQEELLGDNPSASLLLQPRESHHQ